MTEAMWFVSLICSPFLVYGLWTGRLPVMRSSQCYLRKTEPIYYWTTVALYLVVIAFGILATFYPTIVPSWL